MKKEIVKILQLSVFLILAIIGLSGCNILDPTSQSTDNTIRIGTTGTLVGWSEKSNNSSQDNGLQGYEIDIWKEIAKRNNWKIEWKIADFSALWGMLDSGQIDTVANHTSISPKREEKYNFSSPYAYGDFVFFVKDSGDIPKDLSWFNGKTVCVNPTANPGIYLDKLIQEKGLNINVVNVEDLALSLKGVENGQYDAVFVNKNEAYAIQENMKGFKDFDPKYKSVVNAYPFRKLSKEETIRQKADEALKSMEADGTLSKLAIKWNHYDVSQKH